MRDEWFSALKEHLDRIEEEWDPAAVLDPRLLPVAQHLREALGDDPADLDAWLVLGRFHMHRDWAIYDAGEDGWQADNDAMFDAFTRCFIGGVDVPEDLRATTAERAAAVADGWISAAAASPDADAISDVARLWQRIVAATPIDSPARASMLANLGIAMRFRYSHTADTADLDAAITLGTQALAGASDDDPELPAIHFDVALASLMRSERNSDHEDLDTAVAGFRQALDGLPEDHPARPSCLSCYGTSLRIRFEWHGDPADLDAAISAAQEAVSAADERGLAGRLLGLGTILIRRFSVNDDPASIDVAIATFRRALQLRPRPAPASACPACAKHSG